MSAVVLDKLVSSFLQDQAADRPDMLWHYTNAAGFLGIFRSGKLWATNTDYLNDASEMQHARPLVLKAVFDSRSSAQNREEHEMLKFLCDCMGRDTTRPVFVASLSAAKNELSQWRAYGGGTGSFALGFNLTSMLAAIGKNTETRLIFTSAKEFRRACAKRWSSFVYQGDYPGANRPVFPVTSYAGFRPQAGRPVNTRACKGTLPPGPRRYPRRGPALRREPSRRRNNYRREEKPRR